MIRAIVWIAGVVWAFGMMLDSYVVGLALALCLGLYAIAAVLSFVELSA